MRAHGHSSIKWDTGRAIRSHGLVHPDPGAAIRRKISTNSARGKARRADGRSGIASGLVMTVLLGLPGGRPGIDGESYLTFLFPA